MTEKLNTIHGVSLQQWEASFRAGIDEFSASFITFTRENYGQVRIAFGNSGPYINAEGERTPVFTHAVTLPPDLAIELSRLLLKSYAEPEADHSISSKQL